MVELASQRAKHAGIEVLDEQCDDPLLPCVHTAIVVGEARTLVVWTPCRTPVMLWGAGVIEAAVQAFLAWAGNLQRFLRRSNVCAST